MCLRGGGIGGCEFVCLRLCPVWPLSVKVESSAEAYGKPQPSPRYSTIEAHSPEKPSETFYQHFFVSVTLQTPYFLIVLVLKYTKAALFMISFYNDISRCLTFRTAVLSQHALAPGLYAQCTAALA